MPYLASPPENELRQQTELCSYLLLLQSLRMDHHRLATSSAISFPCSERSSRQIGATVINKICL